jgi:hypothetical protein
MALVDSKTARGLGATPPLEACPRRWIGARRRRTAGAQARRAGPVPEPILYGQPAVLRLYTLAGGFPTDLSTMLRIRAIVVTL